MKIGIMGAGGIAEILVKTMQRMDTVTCYAIGSRSQERADAFAKKYNIPKAYGSYEELAQDEEIELVYIATPHSEHYENAKLCIHYKKPILCEKAFMANAKQAKEIIALAKEKNVFITEAIWTRYMPSRKIIDEIIVNGEIGEVLSLSANLGYQINHVPRIYDPNLAGGALLDVGVYPLNFANMFMGGDVLKVTSSCTKTETGVDETNAIILEYPGKKLAMIHSGMLGATDQYGIIYGTKGYLIAKNINNISEIEVYSPERILVRSLKVPEQISGYEYEIEACQKAIKAGELSCDAAPHEETIRIMELMDGLRKTWGIRYPFE
ncbi:Gfo/Idh/MocA family oxidoreductase [Lachnospiraceae bacterium OttesenSCG-928-E19]|nr:Gfo/Idh/MocA family oxidoreductase [Lachnospiraceae bacterium OttesenSCG-928-E19]